MGADLLTTNLWSKREGDGPYDTFDWDAGLRAARGLDQEAVDRLAFQLGLDEGVDASEVREKAEAYVGVIRDHINGWSRDLSTFDTPDGKWICWLTGGLSWGDSPSELYDAINDLYVVPEVLSVIGFWTRTGDS